MSIRFKFRSSMNYETVDIDGQDSITVSDLKSKIRRHRNVNVSSADCDLVLSDAFTGFEYRDGRVKIQSGSSVIIKRVPASSVASMMCFVENAPQSIDPEVNAHNSFIPAQGGNLPTGSKGSIFPLGLKPMTDNHVKSQNNRAGMQLAIYSKDKLSSEFKCSLCDKFYKAAVMIPCCQNSFCEQCIRLELVNKSRCPICSSAKCRAEDLLPNISLRHAVDHFLESRAIFDEVEGFLPEQVPDGESGNNAKEDSGEMTVLKRDKLVRSPIFNEIVGDTTKYLKFRIDAFTANTLEDEKLGGEEVDENDEEVGPSCPRGTEVVFPDFQRESLSNQKQGWDISSFDAERKEEIKGVRVCYMCGLSDHLMKDCPVAHANGTRACYSCGSVDHLMRDCLEASMQRSMLERGAMFPYWNTPMNFARTFGNQCCGSGLQAYNSPMVPVASFSVPLNMHAPYGVLPAYSGFMVYGDMRYGAGMAASHYLTRQGLTDYSNLHNECRLSSDNIKRDSRINVATNDSSLKKIRDVDVERRDNHGTRKGDSQGISDRSFTRKSPENHQHGCHIDSFLSCDERPDGSSPSSSRDRKSCRHYETTYADVEDSPRSSIHVDKKRRDRQRGYSKKDEAKRGRSYDDRERSGSQSDTRDLKRTRTEFDHTRRAEKYARSSDHGLRRHGMEAKIDRNYSHSSRDSKHRRASRHDEKNRNDGSAHKRWKMTTRSDEDSRGGSHHHHRSRKSSERSGKA